MALTPWRRLGTAALVAALGVAGIVLPASATPAFDLQRRAGLDGTPPRPRSRPTPSRRRPTR